MSRFNAKKLSYEVVEVKGIEMLFNTLRIDKRSLPEGLHFYEIRHDDDGEGIPCEIGEWILVNHFGTLISKEPLELTKSSKIENAYCDLEEEEFNFTGIPCTLDEYVNNTYKEG